ncbi:hypothetical protein D5281_12690 [bacterium 1xD42-62]|uniref:Uncharacterized protein n=1 Tax=Parablautia muri TaxID=2320879 RepID=A0A9X5BGH2_9FIRM|nr:hypothetical protein [Parablautia muri]
MRYLTNAKSKFRGFYRIAAMNEKVWDNVLTNYEYINVYNEQVQNVLVQNVLIHHILVHGKWR